MLDHAQEVEVMELVIFMRYIILDAHHENNKEPSITMFVLFQAKNRMFQPRKQN